MDEVSRYEEIKKEKARLSDKKIRLEERLKSEKGKLEKLIAEITEKGYDPKNLSAIKNEKSEQLKSNLDELEQKLREISEKLNEIEG